MRLRLRVIGWGLVGIAVALPVVAGSMVTWTVLWSWARRMADTAPVIMASNWLAFGAGQALVAATGLLPASMIALMAGAIYGFGWGLLISAASTMLGGWVAFRISRTALRVQIVRWMSRYPQLQRLDDAVTAEGWRLVLLLRMSPVTPFAIASYGLGLTRITARDFLLGTLASLPALTIYVALGALGRQSVALAHRDGGFWRWCALGLGIALLGYALLRLRSTLARLAATGTDG